MSKQKNEEKLYKVILKPGTHLSEDKDHDGIRKGLQFSDDGNSMQGPVDLEEAVDIDLLQFSAEEAQKERDYKLQMKALRNENFEALADLIKSCTDAYYAVRDCGRILRYEVWPTINQRAIPWVKLQVKKISGKQHIDQGEKTIEIPETPDIGDSPMSLDDSNAASNVINFAEYQETKQESASSAV